MMKDLFRKLFCLLMSVTLSFSLVSTAYAEETAETDRPEETGVYSAEITVEDEPEIITEEQGQDEAHSEELIQEDTVYDAAADPASESEDGFIYTIKDGKATVTGYTGSETSISIPAEIDGNPVTAIASKAFSKKGLTHVNLPESITSFATYCFDYCPLDEVILPAGTQYLEYCSFGHNPSLKSIVIPAGLKSNAYTNGPFYNCDNLKDVTFAEGTASVLNSLFQDQKSLEKIVIPEGVTAIGNSAFKNCTNLTEISLPDTLKEIGQSAFSKAGLTHIDLPDSITSFNTFCFDYCQLDEVTLPAGTQYLEYCSFGHNPSLKSIVIPAGLKSNAHTYGPFNDSDNLKDVTFAEGTASVLNSLFKDQKSLEKIVIPEGVTAIGNSAFRNCAGLREVSLPQSLTVIGESAFEKSVLRNVEIPNLVTTINNWAFRNNPYLQTVTIPESVKTIKSAVFENDTALTMLTDYDAYGVTYAISNNIPYASLTNRPTSASLLEREYSGYHADSAGFMINGSLLCTVSCQVKDSVKGKLKNRNIRVYVPSKAVIDMNSVTFNGKIIAGTFDEKSRIAAFPIDEDDGDLRLYMRFDSHERMDTYATYTASISGVSYSDVVGSFNEVFKGISLIVPEVTGDPLIEAHGIAPVGSLIDVYLDGELQDTVAVMKSGSWYCNVLIDNPQNNYYYTVTARIQGTEDYAEQSISYCEGTPELLSFVYDNSSKNKVDKIDLLKDKTLRIFKPNHPYRFEIAFTHPESIRQVYVNSIKGTDVRKLEAVYDSKTGKYVTNGYFGGSSAYTPGKITVTYTEKQPEGQKFTVDDMEKYLKASPITDIVTNNPEICHFVFYTEDGAEIDIDLGKAFKDFENTTMKLTWQRQHLGEDGAVSVFDAFDLSKDALDLTEVFVADLNGEDYFMNWKYDDTLATNIVYLGKVANPALKLVSDVQKFGIKLPPEMTLGDYKLVFDSTEFKTYANYADFVFKAAAIYQKDRQLRTEILYGTGMDQEQQKTALKKLDELTSDKMMFLAITTLGAMAIKAGMMSTPCGLAALGLIAMMKLASEFCFSYRDQDVLVADAQVKIKTDPSGYVYDSVTEDRLEGVKATAYWVEYDYEIDEEVFFANPPKDDEYGVIWDAEPYEQMNPQITDEEGRYQWDVPDGWWRVKYEKDGYKTVWSSWLPVPPPQLEVNIPLESTEAPFRFSDVQDPKKFYYDPVYWAYYHKPQITTGTSPTEFSPNADVTRGQLVTFLWRAMGEPKVDYDMKFTDVKEGKFFYEPVKWAASTGVTTGTSETTFSPNDKVTRGQIVTFLWRAMNKPEPKTVPDFADVKEGKFYYKAVAWAAENGVTTGTSETTFSPNENCNRGQAVTFLYRAANLNQ